MLEVEYFEPEHPATIQITKDDSGYILHLPSYMDQWENEQTIDLFRHFGKEIEVNVLGKPTFVHLVDADWVKTHRKVLPRIQD